MHGMFQFVSLVTTSGFATADTNTWTSFAIILLLFGSIVCACAGSTSGGIKMNRMVLAFKMMKARIRRQQHPKPCVMPESEATHSVTVFIVAYMFLLLIGTVATTAFGIDLLTAFSSSVACLGNVGPGFGAVGSLDNYAGLPVAVRLIDTVLMLLGRLEIFGLIQLFFIKWWR